MGREENAKNEVLKERKHSIICSHASGRYLEELFSLLSFYHLDLGTGLMR